VDECWGQPGTTVGGVFMTEGHLVGRHLGRVDVRIRRQNSNLADVKQRLANEVAQRGGNALCDFKYGQVARKWWKIGWDQEDWYGTGTAVTMADL
jgi:hypothetical protein